MRSKVFWSIALIYVVAVVLNFGWEMAQGFLYSEMTYIKGLWLHCFFASLGDGILVVIIYLIGWGTFRRSDWFFQRSGPCLALTISLGLIIGILVEWLGVHMLDRWSYTDQMPLVPVLEIGVAPILQMLLLPPIIFAIVTKLGINKKLKITLSR